ncbi:zinc finger domain-containing protein [Clavibacter michiganensis]
MGAQDRVTYWCPRCQT